MRTRTRHSLSDDTVLALKTAQNGQPWRACAAALGYPENYAATLNQAARGVAGAMTQHAENVLRVRLGLPPIQLLTVPACPDCGQAHVGRCNGKIVVDVVILGPGEQVTPVVAAPTTRKPRPAAHRPYITDAAKWTAYQLWSAAWDAQEHKTAHDCPISVLRRQTPRE